MIDELDPLRSSGFLPFPECDLVFYEDFSEVDALSSTNNEDKVFNSGILIHENLFEVTNYATPDKNVKKTTNASLILEDFNPPLYEIPFHKEVLGLGAVLSFSSENEEKVLNPGILTSKRVHTSLLPELSHQGTKAFKVTKILESSMEIFLCSYQEDIRILDVPWVSKDKDDLEGIIDYLEPTLYDGFIDHNDEAYKRRKNKLLGMPYTEPPPIVKEEAKITGYNLGAGIGKKGHMLEDIWEYCEKVQGDNTNWWHDHGFEEDERQESGLDIEEYDPPKVHVKTFEVKRYSFDSGHSFIYVTKEIEDSLPLGRENGSRFIEMIRKELDTGGKVLTARNGIRSHIGSYSCRKNVVVLAGYEIAHVTLVKSSSLIIIIRREWIQKFCTFVEDLSLKTPCLIITFDIVHLKRGDVYGVFTLQKKNTSIGVRDTGIGHENKQMKDSQDQLQHNYHAGITP
ncbi:hypothetical protein Tco_0490731 [Tanacetum coccineum]